jgi:hypothetical protein
MPKFKRQNLIRENIRHLETIKEWIDEIPPLCRGKATMAIAEMLLAKLQKYPPYVFYPRALAYGMHPEGDWTYISKLGEVKEMMPVAGYFSAKQFRYVMGPLREKYDFGFPHRTGKMQRGWQIKLTGVPPRQTTAAIINNEPGVQFVYGNPETRQAAQITGVGWQTTQQIIENSRDEALQIIIDILDEEQEKALK